MGSLIRAVAEESSRTPDGPFRELIGYLEMGRHLPTEGVLLEWLACDGFVNPSELQERERFGEQPSRIGR